MLYKVRKVTDLFYRSELRVHRIRFVLYKTEKLLHKHNVFVIAALMCVLLFHLEFIKCTKSEIGTPANKKGYKFDILRCAPWNLFGF